MSTTFGITAKDLDDMPKAQLGQMARDLLRLLNMIIVEADTRGFVHRVDVIRHHGVPVIEMQIEEHIVL